MTTYTLWSQAAQTGTTSGVGNAGTIGLHFTVSQAATLNGVWLYSASGLTQLPTAIGLFNFSTQALIHSETVSSWSGAAGSGWVYAAFSSPPSLVTGTDYLAGAFRNDAANGWFCYIQPYTWPVTSGIITAPKDTSTGQGWYDHTTTGISFPTSQLAGYNWLVDVSVSTSSSPVTSTGSASLSSMSAHGSGSETITSSGTASLGRMSAQGSGTSGPQPVTSSGSASLSSMSASGSGNVTSTVTVHGSAPSGTPAASGSALVALTSFTVAGAAGGAPARARGALVVGEVSAPPPTLRQPPVVNNWLSGDTLDAASLNTYVRDTFMYLANPPLLRVEQTAVQTGIQPAQWTVVNLQQVDEDTYNGWSPNWNVGNAYQAQVPGWYSLTLYVSAAVPPGSLGRVGFWYWSTDNSVWVGPIELSQQVVGPGAPYWSWHAYDETYLQVNDLVLPVFYHQASAAVSTSLSSPSTFELAWISS